MILCSQNQLKIILFNKIELLQGKCCTFFEGDLILLLNQVWSSSSPTLNLSSTNWRFSLSSTSSRLSTKMAVDKVFFLEVAGKRVFFCDIFDFYPNRLLVFFHVELKKKIPFSVCVSTHKLKLISVITNSNNITTIQSVICSSCSYLRTNSLSPSVKQRYIIFIVLY